MNLSTLGLSNLVGYCENENLQSTFTCFISFDPRVKYERQKKKTYYHPHFSHEKSKKMSLAQGQTNGIGAPVTGPPLKKKWCFLYHTIQLPL